MTTVNNYVRTPRRIPHKPKDALEEKEGGPKTRHIICLFVSCIILVIILTIASIVAELMGLHLLALSLGMFNSILLFITIGIGVMMAISYFLMGAFLKREFKKRLEKMDQEQRAQLRRMMGVEEPEESSE